MTSHALYVDFSADNSVRVSAALPGQRPPASALFHCASLGQLDTALGDFLAAQESPTLMGAALSVCGWERDGVFEMPNHSYAIGRSWIRERLDISRIHIVNDCVAAALAIDRLEPSERIVVSQGQDDPAQPKALIALGRALGTTSITSDDMGNPIAQPCAGGHADLPATNDREYAVVRLMAQKYGHVSRVRAVSTNGLVEVWRCLATADGRTVGTATPQDIVTQARDGDPHAREAVDLVTGWLAATAADTALSLGARGGIYLAGSFFDVLGDTFDADAFTRRFHDKGRLSDYLKDICVYQVRTTEPEMVGLSTLFD